MISSGSAGSIQPHQLPSEQPVTREGIAKTLQPAVALLTGGWDKPYALGLTDALVKQSFRVDFVGTPDLDSPELHKSESISFIDVQKGSRVTSGLIGKAARTLMYYVNTTVYAAKSQAGIFHILWNTKFIHFDRTVLLLFYKLFGKQIVFTAHNVNAGKRDGNDSRLNRLTLKIQYWLVDHIFVHTARMREELLTDFHVPEVKVTVIPFGINSTVPNTELTSTEARKKIGLGLGDKVILFFGSVVPYKGLEHLIEAFTLLSKQDSTCRLVIAGKPREDDAYFTKVQEGISKSAARNDIRARFEYIPDEETECYFKAADVVVLPYTHIFQSGVLFLAYNFGLPVIATDVGSLKDEISEGITGHICRPQDPRSLAAVLQTYFSSELFKNLSQNRQRIRAHADERHSWAKVGEITTKVYSSLLKRKPALLLPKGTRGSQSSQPVGLEL